MKGVKTMLGSVVAFGLLVGSAVGAAAQEGADAIAPVWVTGEVVFAPNCEDPAMTFEDGVIQQRGFRCGPQQWQSDDSRFTGTGTVAHSSDAYTTDDGVYQVISSAFEVRNDAGGWRCTNADALLAGTSLFDASLQEFRMTCVGDGDYAGATAILVVDFRVSPAPSRSRDSSSPAGCHPSRTRPPRRRQTGQPP